MNDREPRWTFLTNHALALVYLVQHPDSTVREIAGAVGITERAALTIIRALQDEHIIDRHRVGRRNTYAVNFDTIATYRRATIGAEVVPSDFMVVVADTLARISADADQSLAPPLSPEEAARPRLAPMFTNHALVLLQIVARPAVTVREMAQTLHLTERAVHAILNGLEAESIIGRSRDGRRNVYSVDLEAFVRFPRWSPGPWLFPSELIAVTGQALTQMVATASANTAC